MEVTGRQDFRRQVQINMRDTLSMVVTSSLYIWAAMAGFAATKVCIAVHVLQTYDEDGERPMRRWLYMGIAIDCSMMFLAIESLVRTYRSRENANRTVRPSIKRFDALTRM